MMERRRRRTVGLNNFLTACNNIVQDVVRLLRTDERDREYVEPALVRIQSLSRNVRRMSERFPECRPLLDLVNALVADVKYNSSIYFHSDYIVR